MAGCPNCAARVDPGDRFCESCGAGISTGTGRLSSRSTDPVCRSCAAGIGRDGYCYDCGRRRHVGRDRCELDLGTVAAVTDVGHRRLRNEDAVAVGSALGNRVAVVCDGVSSSPDADAASHAAVDAAVDTLLRMLADGAGAGAATVAAFRAAAAAVASLVGPAGGTDTPSCTFVSAVVTEDLTVTLGWAGDSRAYWMDGTEPDVSACLTVDDSLAGHLDAAGVDASRLSLSPDAFGLTRWLGADAPPADPHLSTFTPPGTGAVVLCSDGLSRYVPDPAALTRVTATSVPPVTVPPDTPATTSHASTAAALVTARRLTTFALDAGGIDNVAVAVLPVTSVEHPRTTPGPSREERRTDE